MLCLLPACSWKCWIFLCRLEGSWGEEKHFTLNFIWAESGGGSPDPSALWDDKKLICNPQAGSEIWIIYLAAVLLLLSYKLENTSIHEWDFHLHTSSHFNFKYNTLCMFMCLPHMAHWIAKIKIKPSFHFPEEWCSSHWRSCCPELSQFLLDDIFPSIMN